MQGFDPIYFDFSKSWRRRLEAWLKGERGRDEAFLDANMRFVAEACRDRARVVLNMPGDALLGFLKDRRYKSAYERPVVGKERRGPSSTRRRVDRLLGGGPESPIYFAAVAIGGVGVRFYGDYCFVLKLEGEDGPGVLDRNSYDLVSPPISRLTGSALEKMVQALTGRWRQDLPWMIALKVLPRIPRLPRLTTVGAVSDAVLSDEDFIEVHWRATITPADVAEIRLAPEDVARASEIRARFHRGKEPDPVEVVWNSSREDVFLGLTREGIHHYVVTSDGRAGRWGG